MIPPAFFDDGAPGTWLDAIYHSPLLDVRDHAPSDGSKALALPPAPNHGASFPGPVMTTGAGDFFGVGTGNHDEGVCDVGQ